MMHLSHGFRRDLAVFNVEEGLIVCPRPLGRISTLKECGVHSNPKEGGVHSDPNHMCVCLEGGTGPQQPESYVSLPASHACLQHVQ